MRKAVSGCACELSYSCYDLSSFKSFSRSSLSFLVSPHFLSPWGLWGGFIFLMSRLFFLFVVTWFILRGRQYLSYCLHPACACVVYAVGSGVGVGGTSGRGGSEWFGAAAQVAVLRSQPDQHAARWVVCTWLDCFNWLDPSHTLAGLLPFLQSKCIVVVVFRPKNVGLCTVRLLHESFCSYTLICILCKHTCMQEHARAYIYKQFGVGRSLKVILCSEQNS